VVGNRLRGCRARLGTNDSVSSRSRELASDAGLPAWREGSRPEYVSHRLREASARDAHVIVTYEAVRQRWV